MRQRQSISGLGLLVVMMIVMALAFRLSGGMGDEGLTQQEYVQAVEKGDVRMWLT